MNKLQQIVLMNEQKRVRTKQNVDMILINSICCTVLRTCRLNRLHFSGDDVLLRGISEEDHSSKENCVGKKWGGGQEVSADCCLHTLNFVLRKLP